MNTTDYIGQPINNIDINDKFVYIYVGNGSLIRVSMEDGGKVEFEPSS